jgi:hypothetical protein
VLAKRSKAKHIGKPLQTERPSNRQTSNRQTSNDRGSAEAQCHHRCFRQRRCGLNKTALDMSPRKPPRGTPELVERRASTDRAQVKSELKARQHW